MNPANEIPHGAGLGERAWWTSQAAGWSVIVALMLAATGLGLGWIGAANTDLPPMPEFLREAREVYLPAARGESFGWSAVWHEHTPVAHAWKLVWLRLNGQWDERVLSVASLALEVIGLGLLFSLLARGVSSRWRLAALGLVAIAGVALVPLAPRPVGAATWSAGLVVFSLLHLALMTGTSRPPWVWWFGLACGLCNVLAATAGITSAAALVVWSILAVVRDRGAWRERRALLAANGALVVFGLVLAACRTVGADGAVAFFPALGALLAWPFGDSALALIVWAPAILCLGRWMRDRADCPALAALSLLIVWLVAQAVTLAALHVPGAGATSGILLAGLLVNAACFGAGPAEGRHRPTRNLVLVALWCLVVGDALLNPPAERIPALAGPAVEAPVTAALRRAAFDGNADTLRRLGVVSESEASELRRWFGDAAFRETLPGSIRRSLLVEPENGAAGAAFLDGAVPLVPGRDDLPAFGTWSAKGASATGEFVSQPLQSHSALLRIRICGELRPPATSLVLRTTAGEEIAPLEGAFVSNDRWKRVSFATPHGAFRIVARDTSPTAWLAFTAPQEMGRWSWVTGKLVRSWAWWFAGGLALGTGIGLIALLRARRTPLSASVPDGSRIRWSVVPWLALAAYAVFFSRHIDPTAGPNDSGGYLNSAKLLAHGQLTAAPRMIWGPAAGETDITPYLPGTFRATDNGRMAPEYPVGFPLEIAAVAQVLPLDWAVPTVILLQLVLGVVFTRLMARAFGLSDGWAWLAAGIVGLSSVYLFQALQPQSDGPALVWVTAAVSFAWTSREKPWHAVLAGLATALAVMIRPSNMLCVVPILVCLAGRWRQLRWWVLAGVPAALWQMWYNHALYGSWLATGYGDVGSGFALHFAPLTLKSYALWLPGMFTPVVWLAFFGPWLRSVPLRVRLVLASWAAVFVVFYTFYWCTYDNWYNMRFVLPAMPAILVLALFVVRWLAERARLALFEPGSLWRSLVPSSALVVVLLGLTVADSVERRVTYWMQANTLHAAGPVWAREHLPKNAVVFARHATGSLTYYTDLILVRADHEKAKTLKFFEEVAATGRPIYALNYHWERRDYHWENGQGDGYPDLPGAWKEIAVLRGGELHFWAWYPPTGSGAGEARR
jgi:hypothetical protein